MPELMAAYPHSLLSFQNQTTQTAPTNGKLSALLPPSDSPIARVSDAAPLDLSGASNRRGNSISSVSADTGGNSDASRCRTNRSNNMQKYPHIDDLISFMANPFVVCVGFYVCSRASYTHIAVNNAQIKRAFSKKGFTTSIFLDPVRAYTQCHLSLVFYGFFIVDSLDSISVGSFSDELISEFKVQHNRRW